MNACLRIGTASLLWAALAAAAPATARADFESIEAWADASAKDIVAEADNRNATTIFLDSIRGEPQLEGSSGSRLAIALDKAIKKTRLSLSRQDYQFKVQGLFRQGEAPSTKKVGIEVTLRYVDRNDEPLGRKTRFIFGESSTHSLLNTNVHIPPGADDRKREDILRRPTAEVKVEGTKVRTAAGSPYAVEVLVRENGKLVPRRIAPNKVTNRPFVEIHRNEVFAIRLHNESDYDAYVHVTIDGLSVFAFSTIKEQPMYFLVPRRSTYDVLGWKINENETDLFKSVEFPKGAAAEKGLSQDDKIGVFNALFSAAWAEGEKPPPGEAGSKSAGRDERVVDKVKLVSRFVGGVRDSISVRYERELPLP